MKPITRIGPRSLPRLRKSLLEWYDANRRDLPWRKSRDPYRIWISEIMLQQTRVAAVLPRYERFLSRFSSVSQLASARLPEVLTGWSGLGYYHRARNLHAAAKMIVQNYRGKFPKTSESWRELPGIGRYTAAAIASIAFDEPVAVLDGNVNRVLRRLFGRISSASQSWKDAEHLLDLGRPGDFNQAIMELGAMICLPAKPLCAECPIRRYCRTRGLGQRRRSKPRQRKSSLSYRLAVRRGSVLMVQRSQRESLMKGMWELPAIKDPVAGSDVLFNLRHSITVNDYRVTVVKSELEPEEVEAKEVHEEAPKWVRISRLPTLPLTGLAAKILQRAKIIQ
jgi:A/G-specific adenine glycosylase